MADPVSSTNVLLTDGGIRKRWVMRFYTNGGSNPVTAYTPGYTIVSMVRFAAGILDITFPAGIVTANPANSLTALGKRITYIGADLMQGTAVPGRAAIQFTTVNADGTFTVRVYTFAAAALQTAADIIADANNIVSIHFETEETI